ncbi:MAG: DUF501 domain-containing protein [Actinobacteria bacterium]|nr:DUF501 domain-containing protein [Actinomycetota bacterium]
MSGAEPSPSDLSRLVARQLGRQPSVKFEVASKCVYGWPSVILNQPLDLSGEPHPNLYYLTCPWLRRELARLEDGGFIGRLQQSIAADAELRNDLKRCQADHAAEYRSAMEAGDHGLPQRDMFIAGVSDKEMLKCLHSQMAWFLVHPDYLAGQVLVDAVGELWCPDERCAGWMDELMDRRTESPGREMP